jgi:hypothetical protein
LEEQAVLKNAAMIARTFRLDPVDVLNSSVFLWQVRVAAHNVVAEAEKQEAAKIKSKSK